MSYKAITVTDDTVLEYPIGFSVLQRDLGVWLNGDKMIDEVDYTFDQSSNSVTFNSVEVDDVIMFRIFKDKI